MADERIDIIITDQISTSPAKKLREIAAAALSADKALDKVRSGLSTVDGTGIDKLATASSKLTNAKAREVSATARLVSARSKEAAANSAAAVSAQRLATEEQRTAVATSNAANAATRARTAIVAEEAATLRLAAAKDRQASASGRAAVASSVLTRNSRQLRGIVQQTSFQLQDIAVQMQMGTRTSVVLGQQLPQLAGAFGAMGAAIGVVLAVGIPLVSYLLPTLLDGSADAATAQEELADAISEVRAAAELARQPVDDLQETYGGSSREVLNYVTALKQLKEQQAINALQTSLLAIEEDDYINALTKTVRGIGNINELFMQSSRAALTTLNLTEDQIKDVSAAFLEYKEAATVEEQTREAQEFKDVLNDLGLTGQDTFNSITTALSRAGGEFDRLQEHLQAQLSSLGLNEAQAQQLNAAFLEFRGAQTFAESATKAQELRKLLTSLGVEFDNELIPTLIEFEGTARQAFGSGVEGANAMTRAISGTVSETYKAIDALDKLKSSGITDRQSAEINLEFRSDPVGRARALATARAQTAAQPAIDNAGEGPESAAISARIVQIGEEAAATEALNQERLRLNKIDREAERKASTGGGGTAKRTKALKEEAEEAKQLIQDLRDLDQTLTGTPFSAEAELQEIRDREQERLTIVEEALAARIIKEEEAAERIVEINRQTSQQIRDIEVARNTEILSSASATFASLAQATAGFAGEQSAAYKALFIISKGFAIAESIIKIQQAAAEVLADPTALTPAQKIANYAIIAAQGASIISSLQAVQFADGGRVSGPGGPRDDRIAAWLSNGEYVINAAATKRNLPLLEAINNNGVTARPSGVQAFAGGGQVSRPYRAPAAPANIGGVPTQSNNSVTNNLTVVTNDADSFMRSETQIAAMQARMITRGQRNL